jgi:hypothetical protein
MRLVMVKREGIAVRENRIIIDGAGNAGTAVVRALAEWPWSNGERPTVEVHDFAAWQEKHAQACLIDWSDVGAPKSESLAARLHQAGWPAHRVISSRADVGDRPRGAYRDAVTLALTDSHASKHDSVLKALQAGSPAIAVGLGPGEAIVESFSPSPGGPGYCCIHANDPSWRRRQPCLRQTPISATQWAWLASPQTVLAAGQLVAGIVAGYLASGDFVGGSGIHLHDGAQDRFSFALDRNCDGPHDPPFVLGSHRVIRLAVGSDPLAIDDLLRQVGPDSCYADRELAWVWHCGRCGKSAQRVHAVHPPAFCEACRAVMQAGLERASGLTAAELAGLHGSPPTLTDLGLAEETLIRCLTSSGALVWVELERR